MNTNTLAPKAIGVLSLDVSGPHRLRDERVITELAQRRGYALTGLVTIGDDTFRRNNSANRHTSSGMSGLTSRVHRFERGCDRIGPISEP